MISPKDRIIQENDKGNSRSPSANIMSSGAAPTIPPNIPKDPIFPEITRKVEIIKENPPMPELPRPIEPIADSSSIDSLIQRIFSSNVKFFLLTVAVLLQCTYAGISGT